MIVTDPFAKPTATCERSSTAAKADIYTTVSKYWTGFIPASDVNAPGTASWHFERRPLTDTAGLHLSSPCLEPRLSESARWIDPPQVSLAERYRLSVACA
jgi:hypothetical protein